MKLAPDDKLYQIDKSISKISDVVAMKLDNITLQINNIESNIENYILEREFLRQYEVVYDKIDRIDFLYNETRLWAESLGKNKSWDLQNKTDEMLSLGPDYPQSMKCEDMTPQYQLFSLYKQLIYTEAQGMAAMAFACAWRVKHTSFLYELDEIKYERIRSIIEYTGLFKNKMKFARNFIRQCDAKYKIDKNRKGNNTYASFNNMYYTTVLDRANFILYAENKRPTFRLSQLHNESIDHSHSYDKICPGWISNCKEVWSIDYCERKEENQTSTKNYYWIKYTELSTRKEKIFGDKSHPCKSTKLSNEVLGGSPIHRKTTEYYPVYCDCKDDSIDTDNKSIRAFSLLWVVTGARLVAKDRMIHIQLREGKLLPYGEIDKNTERWVPLPTFKYEKKFPNKAIHEDGKEYALNEYVHFISIQALYSKVLCLQKLTLDGQYLLIGVRFKYDHSNHLRLETKYIGFNHENGNINTDTEFQEQSCKQLPELILNNPDDPLKFNTHPHDSKENQFITIRASDLIKDASQTTIPFFDLLEVAPEISVPISGIELFHKGQLDGTSGGYISLKIYSLNLTTYMNLPSFYDI
ncbi:uncharacterized protein LOC122860624 [Aphidius gifuensis]|uniref:uncharacterized protein LOC122860624 n=1 Tax=Aphidius gifuensis TaxID=684658 RepID=UPI001CDC3C0A|nr:uncharacterized protein LOC122860624 [Aphidius gifuensis]